MDVVEEKATGSSQKRSKLRISPDSSSKSNSDFFVRCNTSSVDKSDVSFKTVAGFPYKKHNSYKKKLIFDHDHEKSEEEKSLHVDDPNLPCKEETISPVLETNMPEPEEVPPKKKKKKKHKKEEVEPEVEPELEEPKKKKKKMKVKDQVKIEENEISESAETHVSKKHKKKKEKPLDENSGIYDQVSRLFEDLVQPKKKKKAKSQKHQENVQSPILNTDNSEESEMDMSKIKEENQKLLEKLKQRFENKPTSSRLSYEEASGLLKTTPQRMSHSTPKFQEYRKRKFEPKCAPTPNGSVLESPGSSKQRKLKSVSFSIQFKPKESTDCDENTYYRAGLELERSIQKSMSPSKKKPKIRNFNKFVEDNLMETTEENENDQDLSTLHNIEVTDSQLEKLKDFHVMLPWSVHPLHMVEKRLIAKATKEQRFEMENAGYPIKQGIYTKAEDDVIKANWEHFMQLHDLRAEDISLFTTLAHKGYEKNMVKLSEANKLNFARFLAHGLDERLISSVYQRFKRLYLYRAMKSGRFSSEEDRIILEYLKCHKHRPFADLEKMLKRPALAIEKRAITLKKLEPVDKVNAPIKWETDLVKILLECMLRATKLKSLDDLKSRKLTLEEWKAVSKEMDIPWHQLLTAWNSHVYTKVFIEKETKSEDIRKKLIQVLITRGERDWRSVDWDDVAEQFDGISGKNLYTMLQSSTHYHVPPKLRKDLKSCLEFLNDKLLPQYTLHTLTISNLNI